MKGKLANGFEYDIDVKTFDDMRFLDALAEADAGDPLATSRVCTMLLGKEQKAELYKILKSEDGRVPIADAIECLKDIMADIGDDGKNS
jgi:hypothetical protein